MTAMKPRRSVLYMPGSNARALEKGRRRFPPTRSSSISRTAVAPDAKGLAREQVCAAVDARRLRRARDLVIRINAPRYALGRG